MPALRCVFLGYLWPIAQTIVRSQGAVLLGCGIELQRSKSPQMVDFCEREKIPWFDAKLIRSNPAFDRLTSSHVDLIVVGAFGQILNKKILGASRYGILNLHPSLLPAYKGGSPIEEMILKGETKGGATFHWMVEGVDEGPIVKAEPIPIGSNDDYATVLERCVHKGEIMMGELLKVPIEAWPRLEQTSSERIYAPRTQEDGRIDWQADITEIQRKILALGWRGWARARTQGQELIVRRARIVGRENLGVPGEVFAVTPAVVVACQNGALELLEYDFFRPLVRGEVLI